MEWDINRFSKNIEIIDWRLEPEWKSELSKTEVTLEKLHKIRELSATQTQKSLTQIIKFAKDDDWKVRLEVIKALKKYLDASEKIKNNKAEKALENFQLDGHPLVELCLQNVYKALKKEEKEARKQTV